MSDYYAGCYTPAQMRTFAAPIRGPLCQQDVYDADLAAGRLVECNACGDYMRPDEQYNHDRRECPAEFGGAGYRDWLLHGGDPLQGPPAQCSPEYAAQWQAAQRQETNR